MRLETTAAAYIEWLLKLDLGNVTMQEGHHEVETPSEAAPSASEIISGSVSIRALALAINRDVAMHYETGEFCAIAPRGGLRAYFESIPLDERPRGFYEIAVTLSDDYDPEKHLVHRATPEQPLPHGARFAYQC